MSAIQEWFYIDAAGQQVGPVAADHLHDYVSAGHINADSQLWTEGMEAWLPASQIEGLIPVAAPQHTPQINLGVQTGGAAAPATAQVNRYTAPTAAAVPQEGGDYPIPAVNKISFGLYISCLLGGVGLIILGSILIASSAPTPEEVATNPNALEESGSVALPTIMMVIGFIVLLVSSVLQFMAIHRAWTILKPGGGSVSPGAAVGFLFIPIFGPIWMIIVLSKLPGEWNGIVAKYTNTSAAPRLSVAMAICAILLPVIGHILWMSQVTKAINFMVTARIKPATQQQPASPGGFTLA